MAVAEHEREGGPGMHSRVVGQHRGPGRSWGP